MQTISVEIKPKVLRGWVSLALQRGNGNLLDPNESEIPDNFENTGNESKFDGLNDNQIDGLVDGCREPDPEVILEVGAALAHALGLCRTREEAIQTIRKFLKLYNRGRLFNEWTALLKRIEREATVVGERKPPTPPRWVGKTPGSFTNRSRACRGRTD